MKLSMVLSASRSDELVLEQRDLERALEILDKTEEMMGGVFAGLGKSATSDLIPKVMADLGQAKTLTLSDLMKKYYLDADKFTMMKVIETLDAMGFLHSRTMDGEITLTYRPEFHTPFAKN
jgi:hypothetical protein